MTKSHLIAAMALCAGLLTSLTAEASDPTIEIVSRTLTTHLIPKATFGTLNWGTYGPPTLTTPSRGALTAGTEGVTYTPASEFWSTGFDSFRYSWPGGSTLEEVYLVADLKELALASPALVNCVLSSGWSIVGDPNDIQLVPSGFFNSGCGFAITLGSSQASYILIDRLPGPGGGNTSFILDTGPNGGGGNGEVIPSGPTDELLLLRAKTPGEDIFLEVYMVGVTGIYLRAVDRNGQYQVSSVAPLPQVADIEIGVNYWYSSGDDAEDGGAFLTIEGIPATDILGLDNFAFKGVGLSWLFGSPGPSLGWSGELGLSGLEVWGASKAPVYLPLRSESGDVPDLSSWDSVMGVSLFSLHQVNPEDDPEYELTFPSPSSPVVLIADIPNVTNHLSAAVTIGLDGVSASSGDKWILIQAEEAARSGSTPVAVQLRKSNFGSTFEVRLVLTEGTKTNSSWYTLPAQTRIDLRLNWWLADPVAGTLGGAQLSVEGAVAISLIGRNNQNYPIDQIRLGITSPSAGMAGALIVDDFYAWR